MVPFWLWNIAGGTLYCTFLIVDSNEKVYSVVVGGGAVLILMVLVLLKSITLFWLESLCNFLQ